MTKEELAAKLNGREYGEEITHEEEMQSKANRLVVVFGYSDDNIELRGALTAEEGCYGTKTFKLTKEGFLPYWDRDEEKNKADALAWFRMSQLPGADLKAVWCDGYSWAYETEIPHAAFDILEDEEKFCRGIVFSL